MVGIITEFLHKFQVHVVAFLIPLVEEVFLMEFWKRALEISFYIGFTSESISSLSSFDYKKHGMGFETQQRSWNDLKQYLLRKGNQQIYELDECGLQLLTTIQELPDY
jgi:hypothetical protein